MVTPATRDAVPPEAQEQAAAIVAHVREALTAAADPAKAARMAAYMKTDMPFYGVQKKQRDLILRDLKRAVPITERSGYEASILALWALPHREEKYLAIAWAMAWPAYVDRQSMLLYERLIREGAWWDFVDDVAIRLGGKVWLDERDWASPLMDRWIEDPDLWIRRCALIGQIKHKANTDTERLFDYCLRRAHETEFFIRKAIGWALREHSKTDPEAVRDFLLAHEGELAGLSYREGARQLRRRGLI